MAREIFKTPSFDMQREIIEAIINNFKDLGDIFHLQFLSTLIKQQKITEESKFSKE